MTNSPDPVTPAACPSCNSSAIRDLGTKGRIHLFRCSACTLAFADRAFWSDPHDGTDYYESDTLERVVYPLTPNKTDCDRVATIARHSRARGQFLDYGGGLGTTALAALENGFDAFVIEDSAKAVADGRNFHSEIQWIHSAQIEAWMTSESFDAVSLFHVLEHILEPKALLLQVHRIVKPGGVVVIEVPNWGSHMRRILGLNWQYLLDHHVNYFDRYSLPKLVQPLGYTLIETEFRRTFCINEKHPWKEPVKRLLSRLGFAEILRCSFRRQ